MLKGARAETGLAKLETKVLAEDSSLLANDRETIKKLDDSVRRKTLALLWAYLERIDLGDASLDSGKFLATCLTC
jgi:translocation protein SEC63